MFVIGQRVAVNTPGDDLASQHDHGQTGKVTQDLGADDRGHWWRVKLDCRGLEGSFKASELNAV